MKYVLDKNTVEAIRESLCSRLDEVHAILREGSYEQIGKNNLRGIEQTQKNDPENTIGDCEEALRLCMVRYYVRLRKNRLNANDLDEYLDALKQVRASCVSADLRYIDALNIAYEGLSAAGSSIPEGIFQEFCADYRQGLSDLIDLLDKGGLS